MPSAHSESLQCQWSGWRVVASGSLALDLAPDNCSDMRGAISIAKALMPGVREIRVFVGIRPDVTYRLWGGKWTAVDSRSEAA